MFTQESISAEANRKRPLEICMAMFWYSKL